MNLGKAYVAVAQFITKACLALGAGVFWGMASALLVQKAFNINADTAFYAVPLVTVLFVVVIWSKLPKALGFEREIASSDSGKIGANEPPLG